ncbi:MAG TPA: GNAT family N-acetyltransferase [Cytophagales bacterium]|nr:GNAT family N-acetyltransferase [Cytophagales bacterium]HAA17997.1 GNAT family N-acetyltransferase [Cytophagales bacterium]HAP64741.1 GNAT family N-acetyltransferase [Cytophagales bacterium]
MAVELLVANAEHGMHAEAICEMMALAAQQRGTGIAKRTPEYVRQKMNEGKAVIALDGDKPAGFCYIETWSHGQYVANSGLIVHPDFRKLGLAKKIKARIFQLSREKFPDSKIFGITTSLAVMKINSDLGYEPVTFSELTTDEAFWKGCESCKNFDILTRTNRSHCLCTGMLYDPSSSKAEATPEKQKERRWERFKNFIAKARRRREDRGKREPSSKLRFSFTRRVKQSA